MRQIYLYELKASFACFRLQLLERGLPCRDKALFHISELTGQTLPVIMRILLLIKTIQPDQSNPK